MPEKTRTDDGYRHMPKLKCPYGNHRFADVPDAAFRNVLELRKLKDFESLGYGDSILLCPKCQKPVVLSVKILKCPTMHTIVSAHAI